jgi:SAM-dependent methyltransferase
MSWHSGGIATAQKMGCAPHAPPAQGDDDEAMTTASDPATLDAAAVDRFAGRLFEVFTGATLSCLVDIGFRVGLFEAAAAGPATSAELARRAGLHERYVREWLGAMACAGIFEYEPSVATFWLPREHAVSLTGDGVDNVAPVAQLTTMLAKHVSAVADAFGRGGGVPYGAFVPEIHDVMDAIWGPLYRQLLVPEIVPLAAGLVDRLELGARAADVACGTGNAVIELAAAFSASTFVGYDLDGEALARGRARAAARQLTNVTFEQCDAATLDVDALFDAVLVFNALHDQSAPERVLERIHHALVPGGVLVMDEPRLSSDLADNVDNPMAPFTYSVSTLHCLTVSLAAGGAGLGTAWGEQVALRMLADAGFGEVTVHDAPGDPGNAVFVARKA